MPGENLTRIEAQERRAIVDTQSYEIGLDLTPLQTRNLTWVSRTTFAHVHGIITELPVPAFNTGGFGFGLIFCGGLGL